MGFGFVLLTLGVIFAITWASVESGTRWISDPSIQLSFFTWVLCLVMIFLRASAGWRGRKAAVMALVVLGCAALTWVAHVGIEADVSNANEAVHHRPESSHRAGGGARAAGVRRTDSARRRWERLKQRPGLLEGMILSTCNRVEITVAAEEQADAEARSSISWPKRAAWNAPGCRRICTATTARTRSVICFAWHRASIR